MATDPEVVKKRVRVAYMLIYGGVVLLAGRPLSGLWATAYMWLSIPGGMLILYVATEALGLDHDLS